MKNAKILFFIILLFITVLSSCNQLPPSTETVHPEIRTVEVTRVVKQTVEVTRLAVETIEVTQIITKTVEVTRPVPPTFQVPNELYQTGIYPKYDDAAKAVLNYYFLLDQGFYRDAYDLLSTPFQHKLNLENYLIGANQAFKSVKVLFLEPYYIWAKNNGYSASEDTGSTRDFVIQIVAEGEGGMSGAVPNGALQTIFITVLKENDAWKINSMNTAR